MSRRVSLPGADELFRSTDAPSSPSTAPDTSSAPEPRAAEATPLSSAAESRTKGSSGRVRHDEKITVYVTADELLELEATRLSLRRDHGLAVDRGRIVREAITMALEAVEADGEDSPLVRRLRTQ